MTSKLVVNTIEADTGISSVSFASSISMSSTSKFHFGNAGIDIGADTNINRPSAGVLGFNFSGSEKVRIQSNGRVGISTNNPVSALHVLGTTHALGNGGASLVWGDSVYLGALTFDGSAQPVVRSASGKSLIFQVNQSTEALRITSDGNLGLGINSPVARLHVHNSGTGSGDHAYAYFTTGDTGSDASSGLTVGVAANQVASVNYREAGDLSLGTNSTERLRITSIGQLLVGTGSASNRFKNGNGNGATPKFQFETANVDEQNDISLTFGRNNAFGAEIILAKHRASTVGGYTVVQSGDRLGGINFAGSDGTHFRPAALIQGRVDGTPGTADMPGRLEFHTTADGAATPTERMRIHKEGYLTKPYQVAFFAHCTIGDHDLVAGSKFQFNVVTSSGKASVDSSHTTFNGTNVFNASTNTFTAPVAGLYYFTVSVYFRRTGDPLTTLVPRVNNTEVTNGNNTVFFVSSNDITDGNQLCGSLTLQLAANDAVTVHRRTGNAGTTRFYGPHSHFCGHLIG